MKIEERLVFLRFLKFCIGHDTTDAGTLWLMKLYCASDLNFQHFPCPRTMFRDCPFCEARELWDEISMLEPTK